MYRPLDELQVIPPAALRRLATHDVNDTHDLLKRSATPRDRQYLAQETGLPLDELTCWASMADLLRVRPIEPGHAALLVESGTAENIQQFLAALTAKEAAHAARRSQITTSASQIVKCLEAFVALNAIDWPIPSVEELVEAAEEAAELRPRLALAASPDDHKDEEGFRQSLLARAREHQQHSTRRGLAIIGILAGFSVLASAVSLVMLRNRLGPVSIQGDPISILRDQLASTTMSYLLQSLTTLVIAFLVLFAVFFVVHDALIYLTNTRLSFCLFNAVPYRSFYHKVTSLSLQRQQRAGWWSYVLIVIVLMGLLASLYLTGRQVDWTDDTSFRTHFRALAFPVVLGGVIAGVVACLPALRFYLRELRVDPDLDRASIQRYLIFRLSKLALVPIMVVLLGRLTLPSLFQVHAHVYRDHIMPRFRADILTIRAAVTAVDVDDVSSQQRKDRLLAYLDDMITDELVSPGLVVTENNQEILNFAIPSALNFAVWVLFTDIVLLFVLPYLALGGWRRGLLYMAILAAAFAAEGTLQKNAPTWFSLRPDSIGSLLIVAFAVFANALFFDWVFEMVTERRKPCPGCQAQLYASDAYCSICGLSQP